MLSRCTQSFSTLCLALAQFFDRLSALRDSLDGGVKVDQALIYQGGINIVPTDGNGVTLPRTPQQVGWGLGWGGGDEQRTGQQGSAAWPWHLHLALAA